MDLGCGASIYNPDTSDRTIIDCEIIVSEKAANNLIALTEGRDMYLYIKVMGGGCSGHIYEMDLEQEEPNEDYQIITQHGVNVAVHNLDSSLLNGILIDYSDKLMGGGFTISNPNATRTCGCGLSFK